MAFLESVLALFLFGAAPGDTIPRESGVAAKQEPWRTINGLEAHALLDSTRLIVVGSGDDTSTVYGDAVRLRFQAGVSLPRKREVLQRQRLTVIGTTRDSAFYVRLPDRVDLQGLYSALGRLDAEPDVRLAGPIMRSGLLPVSGFDRRPVIPGGAPLDVPRASPPPSRVVRPVPKPSGP